MKIYLLVYEDGFTFRVQMASCSFDRVNQLCKDSNGVDEDGVEEFAGPYYSQEIELEDFYRGGE